jgi:hypothetical protein
MIKHVVVFAGMLPLLTAPTYTKDESRSLPCRTLLDQLTDIDPEPSAKIDAATVPTAALSTVDSLERAIVQLLAGIVTSNAEFGEPETMKQLIGLMRTYKEQLFLLRQQVLQLTNNTVVSKHECCGCSCKPKPKPKSR